MSSMVLSQRHAVCRPHRRNYRLAHVGSPTVRATVHFGGRFLDFRPQFRGGAVLARRVAVIAGDGIGPEVIAEALKVVRAAGVELDTVDYDLGGARYLKTGEVLPDSVLEELRGADAILLGAVGTDRKSVV